MSGSGSSQTCVDRCSNSAWSYYNTVCCPAGSTETSTGVCTCSSSQQSISGVGSSQTCVNKCSTSGWTYYNTVCCPAGATETTKGQCSCTNSQYTLTGTGASAQCTSKCSVPSWTFYTSLCCPPGATQSGNSCVVSTDFCDDFGSSLTIGQCTSSSQQISGTGTSMTCANKCTSTETYCTTQCCKSYMTEINGACVCSQSGYIDSGSACVPKCGPGYNYNSVTKNCDPICDTSSGYTYLTGWTGKGFCCKIGQTACNTVCCPAGQEEVGSSGQCCNVGASYSNGACHDPTAAAHRRALAGRVDVNQVNLSPTIMFGMEANRNNKLCPIGLAACPISGRGEGEYECLDSLNDLQSCGGCASLGTGQDCTAIKGARWMGCNMGKCEVYSCRNGFRKVNGTACERI